MSHSLPVRYTNLAGISIMSKPGLGQFSKGFSKRQTVSKNVSKKWPPHTYVTQTTQEVPWLTRPQLRSETLADGQAYGAVRAVPRVWSTQWEHGGR